MTQHFLPSAKARTLSVHRVFEMNEDQAFKVFKKVRWGGNGKDVTCPTCGTINEHYYLATRRQWRCKDCGHTFSVTSGTIFAFHKLPLKMYLAAIAIYTNAAKGISALQMGRDLDVQYKTPLSCATKYVSRSWSSATLRRSPARFTWTMPMSMGMCAQPTRKKTG